MNINSNIHLNGNWYQIEDVKHSPRSNCRYIHNLPHEEKCNFSRSTYNCIEDNDFWEYVPFIACNFNDNIYMLMLGCIILIFFLVLLFTVLGITTNSFFCPSLAAMSNTLGLSEKLAGVTLLAFGNGATDIFTSVAGVCGGKAEMVLAELIGSGIYITTIIMGSVMVICPFRLNGRDFLRDIIFFICAVFWIYFVFQDEYIELWETAGIIAIYLAYIGAILFGTYFGRKKSALKENMKKRSKVAFMDKQMSKSTMYYNNPRNVQFRADSNELDTIQESTNGTSHLQLQQGSLVSFLMADRIPISVGEGKMLPPTSVGRQRSVGLTSKLDVILQAERLSVLSNMGMLEQLKEEKQGHVGQQAVVWTDRALPDCKRPTGLFSEFFYEIIPIDIELWNYMAWYWKVSSVIQAPIIFILKFIVPVVNTSTLNNGWCKLLNMLNCVASPLFIVFATEVAFKEFSHKFTVWMLSLAFGTFLCVCVYFTSQIYEPPIYHLVFGLLGFLCSMIIIYRTANEVVNTLFCLGIYMHISEATMGLTILAWGNSVADLISNTALAKAGFRRLAFSACIGGPLLNTLLGVGISFTLAVIRSGKNKLFMHYGGITPNCFLFLFYSLISSAIILPLLGFQLRRSYAVYLFILYAIFFLYCVFCEMGITHPLGTQPR